MKKKRKNIIFLSLGSNIGDKNLNLNTAIKSLSKNAGIELLKESPRYISQAMYYTKQDNFLNSVIKASTSLSSNELLSFCQKIERNMGRIKTFKNGPRIIDIDILLYGEKKIFTPILTVPHIGITERDFVAYPLYDIDPSLRINEETIKSIIKKIPNNLKPFIL